MVAPTTRSDHKRPISERKPGNSGRGQLVVSQWSLLQRMTAGKRLTNQGMVPHFQAPHLDRAGVPAPLQTRMRCCDIEGGWREGDLNFPKQQESQPPTPPHSRGSNLEHPCCLPWLSLKLHRPKHEFLVLQEPEIARPSAPQHQREGSKDLDRLGVVRVESFDLPESPSRLTFQQ